MGSYRDFCGSLWCIFDTKGAGKMSKSLKRNCLVCTAVFCLVMLWIDVRIVLGFLFGAIGSVLLYLRNVAFCNAVLDERSTRHLKTFGRFLQSYAIMAIVLIVSAAKPELLNVFSAALGLLLVKICLILETFTERRDKNEFSSASDNSD